MSTAKGMVFGPVGLAQPEKKSSSSEAFDENELLGACPPDVGRFGCRSDTPDSFSKPPSSSKMLSLGAPASLLLLYQSSSNIRFGGMNLAFLEDALMTLLTEKRIFSPAYHAVGTLGHELKCHYFSCFVARFFTDQSVVYFYIQNSH